MNYASYALGKYVADTLLKYVTDYDVFYTLFFPILSEYDIRFLIKSKKCVQLLSLFFSIQY